MYISDSQPSPTEALPTMYDLPSEHPNEPGLPDEYHRWQANLLSATCCPPNYPTTQVFTASDLYLYYDSNHLNWYKRPDWYVVTGISRLYQEWDLRLSYVGLAENKRKAYCTRLIEVLPEQRGHEKEVKLEIVVHL